MTAWPSADVIQAIGVAIATVVGAFSAWQARQVRHLRERIEALEAQMAAEHARFRAAIRLIRAQLRYIDRLRALLTYPVAGQSPPEPDYEVPPLLEDEI
ncbi:hypothetical protein [Nocardia terpenica]|uniref:Uncharacterized protein n=1 Tax=Nocardia terpenica TaxID=455432 RepID=A0A164HBL0_9NOCA|nr:hypothetical protein [Nocardia terpenica]KZM68369.1 hypothetical protein AWN90_10810 [Nocardia terpenica]NQE88715.1 hypothetical protein [Nocardia terpenica]